ncbi:MAG: VCBS repeat-containing protein [Clostridiaceae bacterium]
MKLRVFFLRKRILIYTAIIISVILIIISVLARIKGSENVFNAEEGKSYKVDLTGDGEKDVLNIKVLNKKYYLSVDSKEDSFQLSPVKNGESAGDYLKEWPLNIILEDINRDRIPEIFSQGQLKNKPYLNIFKFKDSEFENILSSNSSILGLIDTSNNKTVKLLSGKIVNNKISLKNYIMVNNKLQEFDYNYKENYIGKDTVLTFIKYIESLPYGEKEKPDIFSGSLSTDIGNIGKLSGESSKFKFHDGFFKDIKSDKSGNISEAEWRLNFSGADNNNQKNNYTISIKLKNEGSQMYSFKIYSLKIK